MSTDEPPENDPRSVDELINAALTVSDEEDSHWSAINALHSRGTRDVLDRAVELCRSACAFERRLGANILGQLGVPERTFPKECAETLISMMRTETSADVLSSIIIWSSFQNDVRLIMAVRNFIEHDDAGVRYSIAYALGGHEDPLSVEMLIRLTRDADPHVRDWATFGLGSLMELDTPEIRAALAARLDDDDFDARSEALVGLARRGDPRVIDALKRELASNCVGTLAIEAAELTRSPELFNPLLKLRESWDGHPALVDDAIEACRQT